MHLECSVSRSTTLDRQTAVRDDTGRSQPTGIGNLTARGRWLGAAMTRARYSVNQWRATVTKLLQAVAVADS
jgi:hypothetical protein